MSLSHRLGGLLSLILLSAPSESRIARLPLWVVTTLCGVAVVLSSAFGVLQWSLAMEMDRRLDLVISGNLRALVISQRMTGAMGDAHRFTISAAIDETDSERQLITSRRTKDFQDYEHLLEKLQASFPAEANVLSRNCSAYKERSQILFQMLERGDLTGGLEYRTSSVRPAFESWQEAQTQLGSSVVEKAEKERLATQRFLKQTSLFLFAAILLPVVFGAACLVAVILLISVQLANSAQTSSQDAWEH